MSLRDTSILRVEPANITVVLPAVPDAPPAVI